MNDSVLNEMVVRGYQSLRGEILTLVKERIESDPLDLYNYFYEAFPQDVRKCSKKLGIDFLDSSIDINKAKSDVALYLIEEDIKVRLTQKKGYDEVLKELGIKLKIEEIRITNGIENCDWFVLFGSPMGHNWFSQKANNLLELCDSEDENYPKLVKMIDNIKANWDDIDPQQPLPDIKKYRLLVNKKVPDGVMNLITKPSGN